MTRLESELTSRKECSCTLRTKISLHPESHRTNQLTSTNAKEEPNIRERRRVQHVQNERTNRARARQRARAHEKDNQPCKERLCFAEARLRTRVVELVDEHGSDGNIAADAERVDDPIGALEVREGDEGRVV